MTDFAQRLRDLVRELERLTADLPRMVGTRDQLAVLSAEQRHDRELAIRVTVNDAGAITKRAFEADVLHRCALPGLRLLARRARQINDATFFFG